MTNLIIFFEKNLNNFLLFYNLFIFTIFNYYNLILLLIHFKIFEYSNPSINAFPCFLLISLYK